jgi:hypothetical protein
LTVAYGKAIGHEHEHGEEEHGEDHEDHEGEEHAEEDHDEDHDHEHGEEIAFDDGVTSARLFAQFRRDDFYRYEAGLSLAVGDEEASRQVVVYGLDFVYGWRENGLEPGGRAWTWTTEVLVRDVESGGESHAHDDHGDEHGEEDHAEDHAEDDDHDHAEEGLPGGAEWGAYTELVYTVNRALDLGTRVGYVEGDDSLETDERLRISPAITAYLDPYRRASLRLQYNYDDLPDSEEHTVWLQLGLAWGGGEVR